MSREKHRLKLLQSLPKGGVGAEIGVFEGAFSPQILEVTQPKFLYLIDPWKFDQRRLLPTFGLLLVKQNPQTREPGNSPQKHLDQMAEKVQASFADHKNVQVLRTTAGKFFELCRKRGITLDWVYLDGDHGYDAVRADVAAAYETVKPGGIVSGDDFGLKSIEDGTKSVRRAVTEFLSEHPFEQESFYQFGGQWAFRKKPD